MKLKRWETISLVALMLVGLIALTGAVVGPQARMAVFFQPPVASYSVSAKVTPASSATDILTIHGSTTKVVKITGIEVQGNTYGTTSAGGLREFIVMKRTTADTDGTSSTPTVTKLNAGAPTSTATVKQYSVSPTIAGTGYGALFRRLLAIPAYNVFTPVDKAIFDLAVNPITLAKSAADGVAINLQGISVPTSAGLNVTVNWTEE